MTDIQRYEINDAGELPVSYGRYVHWEDVEDAMKAVQKEIDMLERELQAKDISYSTGWDDGHEEGVQEGRRDGVHLLSEFKDKIVEMAEILSE